MRPRAVQGVRWPALVERARENFPLAFWIHEPDVIDAPMLENLLLITVPRAGMAATSAKAMADAISAYSIAVAPASSAIKRENICMTNNSFQKL